MTAVKNSTPILNTDNFFRSDDLPRDLDFASDLGKRLVYMYVIVKHI